jgi:phage N-6-adenine-methyltransferase
MHKIPLVECKRGILEKQAREAIAATQFKAGGTATQNFGEPAPANSDTEDADTQPAPDRAHADTWQKGAVTPPAKRTPQPQPERHAREVEAQLAKDIGVSAPTYRSLRAVHYHGTPELRQAVIEKKIGASSAALLAEKPAEEQRKLTALPKEELKRAAVEIRQELKRRNISANLSNGDDGDEWYTPVEIIEAARGVLGEIDLDPASNAVAAEKVKAKKYFTKDDDGVSQAWFGRVFMNPPYSTPLVQQFIAKAIAEHKAGNVPAAIVLVNNCTDTGWFHDLLGLGGPVCLTKGRLHFWRPDRDSFAARQGQAIFYLGPDRDAFVARFRAIGCVLVPA